MSVREYNPSAKADGPKVPMVEVAVEVLTESFLGQGMAGQLCFPGERVVIDVPADKDGKPVIGNNLRLLAKDEPLAPPVTDAPPVPGAIKAGDLWLVPDGEGKFVVWNEELKAASPTDDDPLLAAAREAGQQPAPQAALNTTANNAEADKDELDGKNAAELRAYIIENGGKPVAAAVKRDELLALARAARDAKAATA